MRAILIQTTTRTFISLEHREHTRVQKEQCEYWNQYLVCIKDEDQLKNGSHDRVGKCHSWLLLSVHRAMGKSTGHVQLQNGMGTGIYKLKWLITNAAGYVFGLRGAVKNIPRALRKFSGSFRLPQDTVESMGIKLVRGLLALLGSHNCQAQ